MQEFRYPKNVCPDVETKWYPFCIPSLKITHYIRKLSDDIN